MKKILIFLLPILTLLACESKDSSEDANIQKSAISNILSKYNSPYIDWYLSDKESFISYSCKNYPQDIKDEERHSFTRGTEDNTITLKNGIKIRLHDEYSLKDDGGKTTLQLTRSGKIQHEASNGPRRIKADNDNIGPFTYYYSLNSIMPINITSPLADNYDPIPMCYYDNFILRWNGDPLNENGVVIITEWNGCTIYDSPEDNYVVHADIVPDVGQAVLSHSFFEDMPDEALVNLWIIRGNMLTLGEENEGEISLEEALQEPPEFFEELLSTNPNLLVQLQPFALGSGAVAGFSFFLIRELYAQE